MTTLIAPSIGDRTLVPSRIECEFTDVALIEPVRQPQNFPDVGQCLFGFTLHAELGRGSFGRVYLASQADLADRPVALKVTQGANAEAQNLARLQHTNIVPVYSAHRNTDWAAFCMPYLGGTTLADVCTSISELDRLPVSGTHVIETLAARRDSTAASRWSESSDASREDRRAVSAPSMSPSVTPVVLAAPNLTVFRGLSYVQSVLWIVEKIAEGLAHAHARGILHRDLKPANILLTDDAQPMILDFNLAQDADSRRMHLGGTPAYMSPEQLRAQNGEHVNLDARADLYALGIIMVQLLTGTYPFTVTRSKVKLSLTERLAERQKLNFQRPFDRVYTPTVDAIARKCLAYDPDERYQSAQDLIDDLQLHRNHRPVTHAANPSWRERAVKWSRRHPRLASPTAAASIALLVAGAGAMYASAAADRNCRADNAIRGRDTVAEFDTLHGTAEQYLTAHHGQPELLARGRDSGGKALNLLTAGTGAEWRNRPEFEHFPAEEKDRLESRASELVHLLSTTPGAKVSDLAAPALATNRQAILDAAQLHASGKVREALPGLLNFTAQQPGDSGGWFLLGRTTMELGQADDAYHAYSTGIALRPRYAPGYYFRALVADRLKKMDPVRRVPQALLDADRAVELDPDFVEARLLRAQLCVQAGEQVKARADLDVILAGETPPSRAWFLRAKLRETMKDTAGAAEDRQQGMTREPASALDYIARGTARRKAEPQAALNDYRSAEAMEPGSPTPLENQAYVQAEVLKQPAAAVETLTRLLAVRPNAPLLLISRGVYRARVGQMAEAAADAEAAVKLDSQPAVRYRAACVYALAGQADDAMMHLAAALQGGFGHQYLLTDADLDPLRTNNDFRKLTDLVIWLKTWNARQVSAINPQRPGELAP